MKMSERLKQYWAMKQASLTSDVAGTAVTSAIPYVALSNIVGGLHGWATDDIDVPNDKKGFIPGVGSSRLERRQRKVRKDLVPNEKWQTGRIIADEHGPFSTALLLGMLGAAAGAGMDVNDRGRGAAMGGFAGAGVGLAAGVAGAIAAAITRRRTKEEQTAAEKAPGILNHIIPGRATYNIWKRLGYSRNYDK